MKTLFVKCWVNDQTGEIEYVDASEQPITKEHIHIVRNPVVPVEIPGEAGGISSTVNFDIYDLVLDVDDSKISIRARDIMNALRFGAGEIKTRNASAIPSIASRLSRKGAMKDAS